MLFSKWPDLPLTEQGCGSPPLFPKPCVCQWSLRSGLRVWYQHVEPCCLLRPVEVVFISFLDCLTSISYISTLLPVFVLFVFNSPSSDVLLIPVLFLQFVKMFKSRLSRTGNSFLPLTKYKIIFIRLSKESASTPLPKLGTRQHALDMLINTSNCSTQFTL